MPEIEDITKTIITKNPQMLQLFDTVRKVAVTTSNVLIMGESGTGKELIAKAVHRLSGRCDHAYVAVDCGAIPENLMESELFGYEKGAFTGALSRRIGRFELAHRGTIFLDEVSNVPFNLQAKLLRVLQERIAVPIGGHRSIPLEVRVVSACNVNLVQAVDEGRFRLDLYFRLNVVPVHLPPLRERKEDIPLLADYFLDKFNRQIHKRIPGISEQVLQVLQDYEWPGNIREMENLIERMVVLGQDNRPLTVKDLPLDIILVRDRKFHRDASNHGLKELCQSFERQVILKTLDEMAWNRTRAAQALKIHRNTLNQKIQDWNSRRPGFQDA